MGNYGWRYGLTPKRRNGEFETWQIRAYTPANGRLHVSLHTKDRNEAAKRLEQWVTQILPSLDRDFRALQEVEQTPGQDPRIGAVFDYYLETYCVAKGIKPSSIQRFAGALRDFELFARSRHVGRVSQLSRRIIDEWSVSMAERNLAPKTRKSNLGFLRACLNAAVEVDMIPESPIRKWAMPKLVDPEIFPLEIIELQQILEIIRETGPQIANIVQWIAHTGNRPSDARFLRWQQVNLKSMIVERPQIKTGRLATYPIGPGAQAALKAEQKRKRPGPNGEVFTDPNGMPFGKNYILRTFKKSLNVAKFARPVTLKDLRHTFAYHMVNTVGTPLPIVQVLLGHRDIQMTMRYVQPGNAAAFLEAFESQLKGRNT